MQDLLSKIYDYSLEEIMGERFGRYSKYIIQDRAIPDVRDGLKPVQRRILYAMYKEKNTYDKPYRKSVKTVGNVIGNYHPHGDTSVYDAIVRMSQEWKQKNPLIEMHGNKGSIDGDSAAAMRYTEARLSKISNEILKDIDKDTVLFAPNFDDTTMEPTVLPSRYPNLLVNGSSGISAGYATNIPPHNLGEVIEAVIKRLDSPNSHISTISTLIKGPDFPTGGIVEGLDGILKAYKTGKGRVIIRAKTKFEKARGKDQLIIMEIPYEVNKSNLIRKIDDIRIDKKIDGILEVRDESDRDGLRIAIDLKRGSNQELILDYLFKNTDLQVGYNFNMVAIVNRRPRLLGLLDILDAYITHQKEVVRKRTIFDLEHAQMRHHIVEGLIKAISILDDIIKTIRKSINKQDAKHNLIKAYTFTEVQAEAIVTLQLYKLTNTDVTLLQEELNNLNIIINGLTAILNDETKLKNVIKSELKKIKQEYNISRLTVIKEEIREIKIDNNVIVPKEKAIVIVTNEGYLKRVSLKSYAASNEETTLKQGDYVIARYEMLTTDTLLLFTNFGNYLYIPVYDIWDMKWKELGKHVSNMISIKPGENIIGCAPVTNFNDDKEITFFTNQGMIKRTKLKDFEAQRYSKPMTAIRLKDNDYVTNIALNNDPEVFIITQKGYGLWFDIAEVPIVGLRTLGVKAINLKDDQVVGGTLFKTDQIDYISLFTNKKTGKRVRVSDVTKTTRARRGILLIRDIKTNPHRIMVFLLTPTKNIVGLKSKDKIIDLKLTDLPIMDRYSAGSIITKEKIDHVFLYQPLSSRLESSKDNTSTNKVNISLNEIDDKFSQVDDILKRFKTES